MSVSIPRHHDFAETCVFTKQSVDPLYCESPRLRPRGLHPSDHPLSRSYGAILPSSLTGVLSNALGCSPCLPVSDCGTVTDETSHGEFSRQRSLNQFVLAVASTPHLLRPAFRRGYASGPGHPTPGWPSFLRPRRPSNAPSVVAECSRLLHRLRQAASA